MAKKKKITMPFGQYRGREIAEVDLSYLLWFMREVDGQVALKAEIEQHLKQPEVQEQIKSAIEAREKRTALKEARAEALSKVRIFKDFDTAAQANLRTKTAWKELGYRVKKDALPAGLTEFNNEHFLLFDDSQVELKELTQNEKERLDAIAVLDRMRAERVQS